MRRGILMAVAVCGLAWATDAFACEYNGKLVCTGTTDPIVGAVVGISNTTATSDALGNFAGGPIYGGTYDIFVNSVNTGLTATCSYTGQIIPLGTIEVSLPGCGGGGGECDVSSVNQGWFCLGRPLGDPVNECAYFGDFVPVGEGFNVTPGGLTANMTAGFAIVKSGRACYGVTVDVAPGDLLVIPAVQQGVSHVTYCSCPPAP